MNYLKREKKRSMNISSPINSRIRIIFLIYGSANVLNFCSWEKIKRITNAEFFAVISKNYDDSVASILEKFDQVFFFPTKGKYIKKFDADELENTVRGLILSPEKTFIFSFNEIGYEAAAHLRALFGLPGQKSGEISLLRNKFLLRSVLQESSIPELVTPKYQSFDKEKLFSSPYAYYKEVVEFFSVPFIVKPKNASGCYGVEEICSEKDFTALSTDSSLSYLIEEYIAGDLYHVDSLVIAGKILKIFASKYNRPLLEYKNGLITGSIPLLELPDAFQAINERLVQSLSITDGILHTEVFFSKQKNSFVFLESTLRPGGALIIPCYQKTFGVNLVDLEILKTIKEGYESDELCSSKTFSAWAYLPPLDGEIKKLFLPKMDSKVSVEWFCQVGDVTKKPTAFKEKLGRVLLENTDYSRLEENFKLLSNFDLHLLY